MLSDHWRTLKTAWSRGVATMARAGAGVLIDDVFLDGAASHQRTNDHLEGLDVLCVGSTEHRRWRRLGNGREGMGLLHG